MSHASSPDLRRLRRVPASACPVPEDQAHALLDGELDAETAATVREHLERCRDCRVRVGRLSRFLSAVRRQRLAERTRAPASLRARLRALLAPPSPPAPESAPTDDPA